MLLDRLIEHECLPAEIEEGNVEYKLKLIYSPNYMKMRIEQLMSQMKWRLAEGYKKYGKYCAYYCIGLNDNGTIGGLDTDTVSKSVNVIKEVVNRCNAVINSTHMSFFDNGVVATLKVSIANNNTIVNELRVAMLGNTNVGKSSIIGTMTYNIHDDGNGMARYNIFRFKHEHESGQTSSIKSDITGYKGNQFINYTDYYNQPWENIVNKSDGIISFIDLPGDSKYLKTTLFGIMAYKPHVAMIVVDGDNWLESIDFNIKLANHLNLQILIVMNKIDLCGKFNATYNTKLTEHITNTYNLKIELIRDGCNIKFDKNMIHMLEYSCVTHVGVNLMKQYLINYALDRILNVSSSLPNLPQPNESTHFLVNDCIIIPEIGIVLSGIMASSMLKVNGTYLLGPFDDQFYDIKIKSIHKKQVMADILHTNEMGSIMIEVLNNVNLTNKINKHLSIIDEGNKTKFTNEFNIMLYDVDCDKLNVGMKLMIYCNNVVDTCCIKSTIENKIDTCCIKSTIENKVDPVICVSFLPNVLRYIERDNNIIIRECNNMYFGRVV